MKTTEQNKSLLIANYIVNMVKSVNKSLDYALSISCWYTMTDEQNKEVDEFIKENW